MSASAMRKADDKAREAASLRARIEDGRERGRGMNFEAQAISRCRHINMRAILISTAPANAKASAERPTLQSATAAAPKMVSSTNKRKGSCRRLEARGATNEPQITAATSGAPNPSKKLLIDSCPVRKPQYPKAMRASSSRRKRTARFTYGMGLVSHESTVKSQRTERHALQRNGMTGFEHWLGTHPEFTDKRISADRIHAQHQSRINLLEHHSRMHIPQSVLGIVFTLGSASLRNTGYKESKSKAFVTLRPAKASCSRKNVVTPGSPG